MQRKVTHAYRRSDLERYKPEIHTDKTRSEFERDRARLLYSSALRKLGDKTQVLVAGTNDFVRTRLTHSLEVAQVGRQLALRLGADPDLVEAACLAHDIGHPPFGHNGEAVLNEASKHIGGFEGNAQTFRLLTLLEPKEINDEGSSVGLNLTRAALDACIKYPWGRDKAFADSGVNENTAAGCVKFNVYTEDLPIFNWVKKDAPPLTKCVEAQIMDLADDISYCVHDFEDAIALGRVNPKDLKLPTNQERVIQTVLPQAGELSSEDLEAAFKELIDKGYFNMDFTGLMKDYSELKDITSSLIGYFVIAAASSSLPNDGSVLTRYSGNVKVSKQIEAQILILKGISIAFVMDSREMSGIGIQQAEIINNILERLMQYAPEPSVILEPIFKEFWLHANNDDARLRVAIDQVASLTDTRAQKLSASLF